MPGKIKKFKPNPFLAKASPTRSHCAYTFYNQRPRLKCRFSLQNRTQPNPLKAKPNPNRTHFSPGYGSYSHYPLCTLNLQSMFPFSSVSSPVTPAAASETCPAEAVRRRELLSEDRFSSSIFCFRLRERGRPRRLRCGYAGYAALVPSMVF